jgi:hypothetical protein
MASTHLLNPMKTASHLLLMAIILPAMALSAADLRQTLNFNREWKFQLGDIAGADAAKFDDTKWDAPPICHIRFRCRISQRTHG